MITLKNFETGATYPPIKQAARLSRVTANRKLFNNDLKPFVEGEYVTHTNLFRKSIEIYTNFLLSAGVTLDFGSDVANKEYNLRVEHLMDILYLVNTDSKRYGVGVATIDYATGLFKVYEPDQWYQIMSDEGNLTHEILVEYSDNFLEIAKDDDSNSNNYQLVTIITNDYLKSVQTKVIKKLKGGKIGEQVGKVVTTKIAGRQIAPLYSGYAQGQEGVSVFDDIRDIVIDMVKLKSILSASVARNSRPHLVAPAGILVEDEDGKIAYNSEGMLFPVNPGDIKPFYLQWDTNADATKFLMEEHWKAYYAITSIPRMLFEPSTGIASSGEALKRMLFPFLSSLSKLRRANIALINQLLVMYDNYLLVNGLPRLKTVTPEIRMDYDKVFEDTNEKKYDSNNNLITDKSAEAQDGV